jgi:hypothetical protein
MESRATFGDHYPPVAPSRSRCRASARSSGISAPAAADEGLPGLVHRAGRDGGLPHPHGLLGQPRGALINGQRTGARSEKAADGRERAAPADLALQRAGQTRSLRDRPAAPMSSGSTRWVQRPAAPRDGSCDMTRFSPTTDPAPAESAGQLVADRCQERATRSGAGSLIVRPQPGLGHWLLSPRRRAPSVFASAPANDDSRG